MSKPSIEHQLDRLRRIRWAVRLTLLLGVAASVAANVLHAEPNPISQAISAWSPLALLLAVELISRVPVHHKVLALLRLTAAAAISAIAAWVSYWHMVGVASTYGEEGSSAYLLPFSVDGLIVIASISLVELAAHIRTIETQLLTATVRTGHSPVPASSLPAAVPAAAPHRPATPIPAPVPPAPPVPAPAPAPVTASVPSPAAVAPRITAPRPTDSRPARPATPAGPATRTTRTRPSKPTSSPARGLAPAATDIVTEPAAAQPTLPMVPAGLLAKVREVATEYQAEHGTPITPNQLAVRVKVTSDQATHALAALDATRTPTPTTVNGTPVKAVTR